MSNTTPTSSANTLASSLINTVTQTTSTVLDTATHTLDKLLHHTTPQTLAPVNKIGTHLCALHAYASDPKRQVVAHHFCSHVNSEIHQCVIYDSAEPNARLIGIEYLISEKLFSTLDMSERIYWHSHKHEVESGMLHTPGLPAVLEKPIVSQIANMYGKIIHLWQTDKFDLPIGPPQLMVSLTAEHQVDKDKVREMEKMTGHSMDAKRKERTDIDYRPTPAGIDQVINGKPVQFQLVDADGKALTSNK